MPPAHTRGAVWTPCDAAAACPARGAQPLEGMMEMEGREGGGKEAIFGTSKNI